MIKVLHLGKLCPPSEGGIEVFSFDLLRYLNSRGIKADLLCFGSSDCSDNSSGFHFYGSETNLMVGSAPLSLDFVRTFMRIIDRYDLLHVHSPNPLAEILSISTPKKVIIHWHSDIVEQKLLYSLYRPIQRKVLKKAQRIICTSPNYLESSEAIKDFRDKAIVVPLGADVKRFEIASSEEKIQLLKGKLEGKKIVLSVGRLVKYKGFRYLIEAAKYLNDEVQIVIVGDGYLYNELNHLARSIGVSGRVHLVGRVKDVSPYIRQADIFCLPSISRNEAFGLVLVEALYFGKPLITTDVPGSGMSYVNQDGITGMIVPPREPYAMANAIKRVLYDNETYNKFSKNARERFKEFTMERTGEKIIAIYRDVLE